MKAQDLAGSFAKKIAKPIFYSYQKPDPVWAADRNYVGEPIAVEDNVLHALVPLKSQTGEGGRIKLSKQPVHCGEVQIPIEDEDSVLDVLAMAIAEADFGLDCVSFAENDLMRLAYEDLHGRQAYSEMRRIGLI
jgi:hypothetical protein